MKHPEKSRLKAKANVLLLERVLIGPEHRVDQPAGETFPLADLVNGAELEPAGQRPAQVMAADFNRDFERAWAKAYGRGRKSA